MKSILYVLTLALFAFGTLTGCGEDTPTNNDPQEIPFGLTMTVNDVPWEADSTTFADPVLPNGFVKEIVAWKEPKGQAERITIFLTSTDPGTYSITEEPSTVSVNFLADNNPPGAFDPDPTPASEGTLIITESTSEFIVGTFTFKGTSTFGEKTYEVKSGTFKVVP